MFADSKIVNVTVPSISAHFIDTKGERLYRDSYCCAFSLNFCFANNNSSEVEKQINIFVYDFLLEMHENLNYKQKNIKDSTINFVKNIENVEFLKIQKSKDKYEDLQTFDIYFKLV
jgi:hypothetical protein